MNATMEMTTKPRRRLRFNPEGESNALLHPRQAAVELQDDFRSMARQLCPRDRSTQDDLAQEMALAILLCPEPQTRSHFRLVACWRAQDYLRWWRAGLRRNQRGPREESESSSRELDHSCAVLNRLAC